jgi:hypothetical protein
MAVTINGTNGITFNNSSTQAQSAGLGSSATAQTWQDLTASRVLGTVYTNSTGYPIEVSIRALANSADIGIVLQINGVDMISGTSGYTTNANTAVTGIVPNGATYNTSAYNGAISNLQLWAELR